MGKKIKMQTAASTTTINDAWELFIKKKKVNNLSTATLKTYQCHYEIFKQYINAEDNINSISIDTIDNYIMNLRKSDIKDITINSYLRTIRTFLYWCMENNYVKQFKINMIKADKEIKETYTNKELELLLKKPNLKKCDFSEYKIWVFENYLLGTGNRISSALNVKIKDIDFDTSNIIVTKTKNRNQQIIPLSNTLNNILKEYLSFRGGSDDDYLFCNACGGKADLRTYQEMVADYNQTRNVQKTSCHLFRHTFAKIWILNGGDIFRLQKILGHSDLSVVKEYVNMFSCDLNIDFDKFNPLDQLSKNKTTIKINR